jgi:hypothetical protein
VKHGPLSTGSSDNHWRELYIAALFEKDQFKRIRTIAEAQTAIVAQRQKSMMPDTDARERDTRETQVLDTALLSLQALANCLSTARRAAA